MSLLDDIKVATILKEFSATLLIRNDSAEALREKNPIPQKGELVAEYDTGMLKLGDGVTAYNDLNYINISQEVVSEILSIASTINNMAQKPENYTAGNLVVFSEDGDLEDSGITPEQYGGSTNVKDLIQDPDNVIIFDCSGAPIEDEG